MRALRIGLVDLDTSHPAAFVPLLRAMGHEIAAVYDGGGVRPPGYARSFAETHGIPAVCSSPAELVGLVDAAMLHGCDWDRHAERARPFVEAGKAVFIDKPLAGNAGDIRRMLEWERGGARIAGGSALLYCREAQAWKAAQTDNDGWVLGLAGCSVDEFNYGIHAYAMLCGLLGPGLDSVRDLGGSPQRQVELTWQDGRRGIVSVGDTGGYLPFYATVVTRDRVRHLQADPDRLYASLLDAVMPYLGGEAPSPLPLAVSAEAELAAIAASLSAARGGERVRIAELPDGYRGYDGAAFARRYQIRNSRE